ncbi:MAG: BT_3928 family protein [Bacteroidota bacterium]
MRYIRNISRIIVGIVFVFSGFVKGIDPLGSTYKFGDYFTAFGLESLEPLAFPLAIILSTFEFIVGFALIFNIKTKINSWIVLIFMGFFTLLTLYLAIENPVSDCGCFGDAIIMTNWETFYKNVIILIPTLIIFRYRDSFRSPYSEEKQFGVLAIGIALMLSVTFYCYQHLPIFDFRPYNVGTHIPEKMEIPEGAPQPEYETVLKYEKDDEIKEFTMDSLPDSTWQWVETKNVKVKEGYKPPIQDFSISTLDGEDITDIILDQNKFTFILIAHTLETASDKNIEDIKKLADYCLNNENCSFISLTSSLEKDIENYKEKYDINFKFYNADEITLKTIIRSNPGLLLLKKGTILDKWHHNDIPSAKKASEEYLKNPEYQKQNEKNENTPEEEISS